jgi:hypothetical protein
MLGWLYRVRTRCLCLAWKGEGGERSVLEARNAVARWSLYYRLSIH